MDLNVFHVDQPMGGSRARPLDRDDTNGVADNIATEAASSGSRSGRAEYECMVKHGRSCETDAVRE